MQRIGPYLEFLYIANIKIIIGHTIVRNATCWYNTSRQSLIHPRSYYTLNEIIHEQHAILWLRFVVSTLSIGRYYNLIHPFQEGHLTFCGAKTYLHRPISCSTEISVLNRTSFKYLKVLRNPECKRLIFAIIST